MVEGTGLENRHTGNGIVSSNLTLSVNYECEVRSSQCEDPPREASRRVPSFFFAIRTAHFALVIGWVAEWFKAHAWKVCVRQKRTVGSNPTPSVTEATVPDTPYLELDVQRMQRNIVRLERQLAPFGVLLRPHVKTAKSVAIGQRMVGAETGPITVSSLREAEAFADAGFRDILYAVGIAPPKLDRVVALRRRGVDLTVILDSEAQAAAVADFSRESEMAIPALIEIDSDGHRSGLVPDDREIVRLARILTTGAELRGVLTHAGESYSARGAQALAAAAENERAAAVAAATMIREAGLDCPVVSVGSTPTAFFARRLDGVTEVRAGVYVFFDLMMVGLGVCAMEDIAVSVIATVIGHRPEKGWILTDAGWMALSRDRGTATQPVDQGFGAVASLDGRIFTDVIVTRTSQEHGTLAMRPGSLQALPDLSVGMRLRIYPNHACATTAQHDEYWAVDATGSAVGDPWPRIRGW